MWSTPHARLGDACHATVILHAIDPGGTCRRQPNLKTYDLAALLQCHLNAGKQVIVQAV